MAATSGGSAAALKRVPAGGGASSSSAASTSLEEDSKEAKVYYWIPDDVEVWSLAYQTGNELPNGCVKFSCIGTKKFVTLVKSKCFPAPEFILENAIPQDFVSCTNINPPSMLHCLKQRFNDGSIYTSCGSIILSVNPFQEKGELYTSEMIARYRDRHDQSSQVPHIYMVPARALANILDRKNDQTILVSGESGSGKTEAIMHCLNYITSVSGGLLSQIQQPLNEVADRAAPSIDSSPTKGSVKSVNQIAKRIQAIAPILEALGNARTSRNNNSTRFCKMLDISLNKETLEIQGVTVSCLMIEKSRVAIANRDSTSRNFHIFYQMLNGFSLEKLRELHLVSNISEYSYLNMKDVTSAPTSTIAVVTKDGVGTLAPVDIAKALTTGSVAISIAEPVLTSGSGNKYSGSQSFLNMMDAFNLIGFEQSEIDGIFRILASILHFGNIEIVSNDTGDFASISNDDLYLNYVSSLLQISSEAITTSLCSKTVEQGIKRTLTVVNLSPHKASEVRDQLVRILYEKLFNRVVALINRYNQQYVDNFNNRPSTVDTSDGSSLFSIYLHPNPNENCKISLLDFFGFEIFADNSHEQMYINYTNEVLHHHFNQIVFISEKKLYMSENINCSSIDFKDNQPIIKEMDTLYKSLDEEIRLPKGSSKNWFDKCKKAPKMNYVTHLVRRDIFVVKHFAGIVEYNPSMFLEKSSDVITPEIQKLMESSQDVYMQSLFTSNPFKRSSATAGGGAAAATTASATTTVTTTALPPKSNMWVYQSQLNGMIDIIRSTENHFIKCFKSNELAKPTNFDVNFMTRQLTYSGLMEVIKMQQTGLQYRLLNASFMNTYRCLLPSTIRKVTNDIIPFVNLLKQHASLKQLQSIQCGINLTFCNQADYYLLDLTRSKTRFDSAVTIQKIFRGHSRLKIYLKIRASVSSFKSCCARPDKNPDQMNGTLYYNELKEHCAFMDKLAGFNVTKTLEEKISTKYALLLNQVALLNEFESNMKERSYESLCRCLSLMDEATKLELQDLDSILGISKELAQFHNACEFKYMLDNSISYLSTLLFDDLKQSVDGLKPYEHIIEGAAEMLTKIDDYLTNMKNEMETTYKMLLTALENGRITIDSVSGHILPLDMDLNLAHPMLSFLIVEISYDSLLCHNTRLLYNDCVNFLKLRDDMINTNNNPFEINLFLQNHTPFTDVYKHEVKIFTSWTERELSTRLLQTALNEGRIPDSDNGTEDEVSVAELSKLIEQLKKLVSPSSKVLDAIEAGSNIIKLRSAFLQKDHMYFEQVVGSVKAAANTTLIFHNFQDCFVELHHCEWQVKYRGLFDDLMHFCEESAYQKSNISSEDLYILISDVDDISKELAVCNSFTKTSLAPKLELLSLLVFDIIALRKAVYNQDVVSAKSILSSLMENHTKALAQFNLAENMIGEVETCKLLIKRIELENELDYSLLMKDANAATNATSNSSNLREIGIDSSSWSYFTVDAREILISVSKLESSIDNLQSTCQLFEDLSSTALAVTSRFKYPLLPQVFSGQTIFPTFQSSLFSCINTSYSDKDLLFQSKLIEKLSIARALQLVRRAVLIIINNPNNVLSRTHDEKDDVLKLIRLLQRINQFTSSNINPYHLHEECFALTQFIYANFLTSEFINILQINCVRSVYSYSSLFSMDIDRVSIFQFQFNEIVNTMVTELRILPAILMSLRMYATAALEFRSAICANKFDSFSSYLSRLKKLNCDYGTNSEFQVNELPKIEVENARLASLERLKITLDTLGAHIVIGGDEESTPIEVEVSECLSTLEGAVASAIDNLPDSCKTVSQDGESLIVLENNADGSDVSINIGKMLVSLLKRVSDGAGNQIDPDYVKNLLKTYKQANFTGDLIERLLHFIHKLQFLKSVHTTIFHKHKKSGERLEAIILLESELGDIPVEHLVWLDAAKIFCKLCKFIESRHNWVDIVNSASLLEDIVENSLSPSFSLLSMSGSADDSNTNAANASKIIAELRLAYRDGFQIALGVRDRQQQSIDSGSGASSDSGFYSDKSVVSLSPSKAEMNSTNSVTIMNRKKRLIDEDGKNMYGYSAMRNSGVSIDEIISSNLVPIKYLWAYDLDAVILKRHKYSPLKLKEVGYTCGDLYRGGYSVASLRKLEYTAQDLCNAGAPILQMKEAAFTDIEIMTSGFQLSVLKTHFGCAALYRDANFSINELLNVGFNIFDLRLIGISAVQFRSAGINDPVVLRAAGFDIVRLKAAGFTVSDLHKSLKCTYKELKIAGFEDSSLIDECGGAFTEDIERSVLTLFFNVTQGKYWKNNLNWTSSVSVSDWFGVMTALDENKCVRVVGLDLHNNYLSGILPAEIANLKRLRSLLLYINDIREPVPENEFESMMPTLQEVDLSNNFKIKGFSFPRSHSTSIPTATIDLTKLSLNGLYPPKVGSISSSGSFLGSKGLNMEDLHVGVLTGGGSKTQRVEGFGSSKTGSGILDSSADGIIYETQSQILSNIYLCLNGKQWKRKDNWGSSAPLKHWYGVSVDKRGFVVSLVLNNNNLCGALPDCIGDLPTLKVLDLRFNKIDGSIPSSICNLKCLTHLYLHINKLSGVIPRRIGNLENIEHIDMRGNHISGKLLSENFVALTHLSYLALSSNLFDISVEERAELKKAFNWCRVVHL